MLLPNCEDGWHKIKDREILKFLKPCPGSVWDSVWEGPSLGGAKCICDYHLLGMIYKYLWKMNIRRQVLLWLGYCGVQLQ